jgi:hypothetical protein
MLKTPLLEELLHEARSLSRHPGFQMDPFPAVPVSPSPHFKLISQ